MGLHPHYISCDCRAAAAARSVSLDNSSATLLLKASHVDARSHGEIEIVTVTL